MANRRRFLQKVGSVSILTGIAGCTGNSGGGGNTDTTPEPWKQVLSSCSNSDASLAIRGVKIDNKNEIVTVSFKNTGVSEITFNKVLAYIEYKEGAVIAGEEFEVKEVSASVYTYDTFFVIDGGDTRSFELTYDIYGDILRVKDIQVHTEGGENKYGVKLCYM